MANELRNRLLIGPLLGGLALGLIAWDIVAGTYWGSVILGTIVALTASREFARLLRPIAPGVQTMPIVVTTLLLIYSVYPGTEFLGLSPGSGVGTVILSLGLVWICIWQMARHALENFLANVAASVFGLVYIGVSMQLLTELSVHAGTAADPTRGPKLLALTIAACKFGDIAAFFGGRAFGRRKLAPKISPGKTWEGFLASLVGSVGGTVLLVWILGLIAAPSVFDGWWQPVVWGLIVGPAGVLGDLVESCLKRSAAMKDSGGGIPGFGGFLDVFDAVLIAAPVAFGLALFL